MKRVRCLCWIAVALLSLSCEGDRPEILESAMRLQYVDDRQLSEIYERLQVFVNVRDEDGLDDLEWLFVINDDSELFWRLHHSQWSTNEVETNIWIGSDGLLMVDRMPLPRDEYRLVVYDSAGELAEASVRLEIPEEFMPSFPTVTVQRASTANNAPITGILLTSDYAANIVRTVTVQGDRVGEYRGPAGSLTLEQVVGSRQRPLQGLNIYVYASPDEAPSTLVVSGPFRF